MRMTITIFLAALLAACSTPGDLKTNNPEPAVFNVKVGYQLVLKRFNEQRKECAPVVLVPIGQSINDVQNYPDLRMATIVSGASGIGTQTHQVIEISETAPNETEVRLYERWPGLKAKHAVVYERWANGGKGCE